MGRDDPQFNLRLPYELKEKVMQRPKMNGRSLNAELVQIVQEAIARPSPILGYRDEAERLASIHAEEFKKIVFDTLKSIYHSDLHKSSDDK
ncbi:Arc family DNA-binding protein [Symbiopectobacterium purcellii]|uniref:Arc family DNA-binding protein n=1 Tax=Symbiopectobacterium purcellii TaxID=2871826 RepID=A0ABX9AGX5_9ENTR|nr:Arc family DNA-binding protein [Symbiopectobacterium purcellii]QZN94106.1 Arc family DNA-binding protein [Symbiopectobacterium purcellii]